MVPMIDMREDRPRTLCSRPQLVLRDYTQVSESNPAPAHSLRRKPLVRFEGVMLASAVTAALGYFLFGSAASLVHSVQQNYSSQTLPQSVVISKSVKRGDTLASLAQRYGNPSTYILEREDQIARANHLTGTQPLFPGQHLQIPVTNPAVIAQIVHSSRWPLVASR